MQEIPLQDIDRAQIRSLCDAVFTGDYSLDEGRLRQCLYEDASVDQELSRGVCEDGRLIGLVVIKDSADAHVFGETAYISLLAVDPKYQRQGIGTRLVTQALTGLGGRSVYVGQDVHNFFSGIPCQSPSGEHFFKKLGFWLNPDHHYDLLGELPGNPHLGTAAVPDGYMFGEFTGERKALLSFITREFYDRWAFEANAVLDDPGSHRFLVLRKADKTGQDRAGQIAGYCMVDVADHGALGPIGIAKELRGGIIGRYLLDQSLCYLKDHGVKDVLIDWTILKDYYGAFGFTPVREYIGAYWKEKT